MLFYDTVACNTVYNLLVWGYRTAIYQTMCRETLHEVRQGWILDAGCGSLAFTAEVYAEYADRPLVLLDQSLTLLEKARQRFIRLCGRVPDNVALVHGDAQSTGFRQGVFSAVVALNLLHIIPNLPCLLRELDRVRAENGPMLCTTLVLANRLADRYLSMWAKAGELTARTPEQLLSAFAEANVEASCSVTGSMAIIRGKRTKDRAM